MQISTFKSNHITSAEWKDTG